MRHTQQKHDAYIARKLVSNPRMQMREPATITPITFLWHHVELAMMYQRCCYSYKAGISLMSPPELLIFLIKIKMCRIKVKVKKKTL